MESTNRQTTFRLRHITGHIKITYEVNEDPARWGYGLLNLGDIDVARGFPVMEARAKYAGQGYGGLLGWVQVVEYTVIHDSRPEDTVWVAPDAPPQAGEPNTPYTSFGIEPTIFDAPAFAEQNVDWTARTFLTYTPDCLMTPLVEPICGFRWGYVINAGAVTPKELAPSSIDDWTNARRSLGLRLPAWTFGGETWTPLLFDA